MRSGQEKLEKQAKVGARTKARAKARLGLGLRLRLGLRLGIGITGLARCVTGPLIMHGMVRYVMG